VSVRAPATRSAEPAAAGPATLVSIAAVWRALASVPDPEVPVVSIVELGIVRDVVRERDEIVVTVTPTYSGCPATAMIEADIRTAVEEATGVRPRVQTALGLEISRKDLLSAHALSVATRADVQQREHLVGADDHRVRMLLKDLHRDAVAPLVALEDQLGAREVDVAFVARTDLLDRKPEDRWPQPIADDHR